MILIHPALSNIRIQKIVMFFQKKNEKIVTKFSNHQISEHIMSIKNFIDTDYNFTKAFL